MTILSRCATCGIYFPWFGPRTWFAHVIAEHPRSAEADAIRAAIDRESSFLVRRMQAVERWEALREEPSHEDRATPTSTPRRGNHD